MRVGDAGAGTLNVKSGGELTTGSINIGVAAGSFGAINVTGAGSQWSNAGSFNFGIGGEAVLTISSGGRATNGGTAVIGNAATSQASITVSGAGSRLDSAGSPVIGSDGAGSITVSGGGVVNVSGGTTILGNMATGIGEVTITGTGSTWSGGGFMIGQLGTGTLTVENGGNLSLATLGILTVNNPAGAPVGTLNFHGGTISAGGFVRSSGSGANFNWTDGTLSVGQSGFNNAGAALVINGADADDRPTLRLTSGSSTLVAQMGALTVGNNRAAALQVTGGSTLEVPSINIGAADGGDGVVTVAGNGSFLIATSGNINVGGTAIAAGGTATLNVENGAVVSMGSSGQLRLWSGGEVNVNGGALAYGTMTFGGGKVNFNSGRIEQFNGLTANETTLTTLLGSAHELGAGRTLVGGGTATLSSNLDINGGRLEAILLDVVSGTNASILRVRSGGLATFNNGATLGPNTRTFVEDGTIATGMVFDQQGELHLSATSRLSATELSNSGLVTGSGRIDAAFDNNASGQVRIGAGERMLFNGPSHSNDGLIDVNGGEAEFALGALTNSMTSPSTGIIAARNATLRFDGNVTNNGAMTFTSGVSEVFGDVTNTNALATPGRIVVSGGAQANFYDDVTNNGSIQVSAAGSLASTAVFLGSFSGNGVSGGGQVFLEGDVRPGFSPGTMAFGGDVCFGPLATLEIELAGTTPGTQYDRLTVADSLALNGALDVTLLSGFTPNAGDTFEIISAAGGITGTFNAIELPTLQSALAWDTSQLYTTGTLAVVPALPGDFNLDGSVDAADYVVWRKGLGVTYTQDDYNMWRANFGATIGTGNVSTAASLSRPAVPEPASVLLWSIGAAVLTMQNSRRRRTRLQ